MTSRADTMKHIPFYKMSGSGNDFIIIDNRENPVQTEDLSGFAAKVCRRKLSAGADGLILVEASDLVDFKWQFFNSDGSVAEMCGNGARCVARFAELNGICGPDMAFETLAGIVRAKVAGRRVKISMPDISDLKLDYELEWSGGLLPVSSVNTGVPHVVTTAFDLEEPDVSSLGREIRFHEAFSPAGTNVNFISRGPGRSIRIRTYERGVEDETLACGTGAVAGAVVSACRLGSESPVEVLTRSGETLAVYFDKQAERIGNIHLEGGARMVYDGFLWDEAWQS